MKCHPAALGLYGYAPAMRSRRGHLQLQIAAGQGRAGQGRAGQGRAGQGRAGQGRAQFKSHTAT